MRTPPQPSGRSAPPPPTSAFTSAALVYEDAAAGAVEQFVLVEERYGRPVVDQAARLLGAKNPDNPKYSAAYPIGTFRRLAGE